MINDALMRDLLNPEMREVARMLDERSVVFAVEDLLFYQRQQPKTRLPNDMTGMVSEDRLGQIMVEADPEH